MTNKVALISGLPLEHKIFNAMKNLFFLSIVCIAMISWAVNSTGEKAGVKPVHKKEMSGNCSNDNYSFIGMMDKKQCAGQTEKCSEKEIKTCNKISENENSCPTTNACAVDDKFGASEAKCSKKEDKIQSCNSGTALVSASASL